MSMSVERIKIEREGRLREFLFRFGCHDKVGGDWWRLSGVVRMGATSCVNNAHSVNAGSKQQHWTCTDLSFVCVVCYSIGSLIISTAATTTTIHSIHPCFKSLPEWSAVTSVCSVTSSCSERQSKIISFSFFFSHGIWS